MDLDSNNLKSVLFSSKKNIEFIRQLNQALKHLIEHDSSFVSLDGSAPQLWECKWINSPDKISGYPKGYAVWVNTNTYEQVLASNYQTIVSYVMNNSALNQQYSLINQNDSAAKNKFLLNAAMGKAVDGISALYWLGDTSDKAQIRISTVDNNKTYPSDLCCWRDFFYHSSYEDNREMLLSASYDVMHDAIKKHEEDYHMLGVTSSDMELSGFFKKSPFNADNVKTQKFFDHSYCNEMDGFDYVVRQKMLSDGSLWCRVWRSGYVEQGGFVDNIPGEAFIPVKFMTTYNYPVGPAFYQRDYQTYDSSYVIDNPIQANNRYLVTVTPVLEQDASPYPRHPMNVGGELLYSSDDITNMSNSGFSIVNTDINRERYSKYSWHACGYKVITDFNAQMFDGSIASSIAPQSAFVIDSHGRLVQFIDNNYQMISIPERVLQINNDVFNSCASAKSIVIPSPVNTIGQRSFYRCSSLQGIVVPNNVKQIPEQAFAECKSLVYAKMGEDVNFIAPSAFCDDTSLAVVSRFADSDPSHTFDKVGDYAFYNTAMKRINLSLQSAGINNFWGDYCFAENTHLEEVNILSACYMSTHMFSGCTNLKHVNFKNNQTNYVYPNVFDECTSLTGITLPSKIWYISEEMFRGCTSLRHVKFSDYSADSSMINLIQRNAFNGCSSLQTLEIPASLTSINQLDDACLCACSLTSVTFHGIDKSSLLNSDGSFIDKINQTGMFRLYHNCTINCKGGEQVRYVFNPALSTAYVAPLDYYHLCVDTTSITGFKTAYAATAAGKKCWYFNAEELCSYVDRTPCVFIYSLLGCKPCQTYMQKLFNNPEFQQWASKQKFYLCSMEVDKQPYFNKELAFCSNKLVPMCTNFWKSDESEQMPAYVRENAFGQIFKRFRVNDSLLNSNLTTPVIVFYYNKTGRNPVAYAHTFHHIDDEIDAWGLSGVIQCFKSLCLYYFADNNINDSTYVVDPVKAFKREDYPDPIAQSQDSISDSDVIVPTDSTGKALTTVESVIADICQRTSTGTAYLLGCEFDNVTYLIDAFPGIDDMQSIAEVNAYLDRSENRSKRFKIGQYMYKFSLDPDNTRLIYDTCSDGEKVLAGYAVFTLVTS